MLGLLPLCACAVLVLVTGRERVATLRGSTLWRVSATRLLRCGLPDAKAPSADTQRADDAYTALLRDALAEPALYFCDTPLSEQDATQSEQDAASGVSGARFFWNAHLAAPLLAVRGGARFVTPLFCGWVGAAEARDATGQRLELLLLARRQVGRPGRRLWTRGTDRCGLCMEHELVSAR